MRWNVDNADSVQISFTALAGGPSLRWTEVMREIIPSALAQNSGYFIADGSAHCTIPGNSLYTVSADGVRLIDWLAALIEGTSWERVLDCCSDTLLSAQPLLTRSEFPKSRGESGGDQWQCVAAFAEHYSWAGFPTPNTTDATHVGRLYRDFERSHCLPLQ
jgi:hypothetical protein